ncbi:MAG: hypothetical protein ACYDC1_00035 [Limisphaerales bacterium]
MVGTAAVAVGLSLCGCGREEVATYRTAKDAPASTPAPGPAADPHAGLNMGQSGTVGMVPEVATPPVKWTLPAGWQELPASQMRVGHFAVAGENGQKAQVTIIPLGGTGGGDFENVNRWRGQVGLARITEAELDQSAESVEVAGAKARLWDFAGTMPGDSKSTRLQSAILHREGTAWFFKFQGDDALVAAQKPAFVQFLKSIHFEAAPDGAHPPMAAPGMAAGAMPTPSAPVMPEPPAMPGATKPAWEVPPGWQEAAPGPMQSGRYTVDDGKDARGEVTVVILPGDAGGTLPNVNRWRAQIGLGPMTEAELAAQSIKLEVPGASSYAIDATNEESKRRVIAAGVTAGARTWFFKLSGDLAAVAAQKDAFLKFIQTVKYGS